jgi:hypothetical protein
MTNRAITGTCQTHPSHPNLSMLVLWCLEYPSRNTHLCSSSDGFSSPQCNLLTPPVVMLGPWIVLECSPQIDVQ